MGGRVDGPWGALFGGLALYSCHHSVRFGGAFVMDLCPVVGTTCPEHWSGDPGPLPGTSSGFGFGDPPSYPNQAFGAPWLRLRLRQNVHYGFGSLLVSYISLGKSRFPRDFGPLHRGLPIRGDGFGCVVKSTAPCESALIVGKPV